MRNIVELKLDNTICNFEVFNSEEEELYLKEPSIIIFSKRRIIENELPSHQFLGVMLHRSENIFDKEKISKEIIDFCFNSYLVCNIVKNNSELFYRLCKSFVNSNSPIFEKNKRK